MEPVAGALMMPVVGAALYNINSLVAKNGTGAIWMAFYINVASWMAQFIGHGFFEKRAPALKVFLMKGSILVFARNADI